MVNARGSGGETNDQALELFFDAFQDYFSYYLRDGEEHADTHLIVTFRMDGILTVIAFYSVGKVSDSQGLCMHEQR